MFELFSGAKRHCKWIATGTYHYSRDIWGYAIMRITREFKEQKLLLTNLKSPGCFHDAILSQLQPDQRCFGWCCVLQLIPSSTYCNYNLFFFFCLNKCVTTGKSLWKIYWHCRGASVINLGINLSYSTAGCGRILPQWDLGNESPNQLAWVPERFRLTHDNWLELNKNLIPLHLVWQSL